MHKRRLFKTAVVFTGFFAAAPAFAAEPVENAINGWIAALDASPDWAASTSGIVYDAAQRTATINGLKISAERPGETFNLTFGKMTVFGYEEAPDGGFSAVEITADDGRATFGPEMTMVLDDMRIDRLAVPSFAGYVFDPNRVFTSMVKAYSIGIKTRADLIRVGRFDIEQTIDNQRSVFSYGTYEMKGIGDGKVQSFSAGPFVADMPSPNGLVKMRADAVEARGFDLDGAVHVFDPDRYVNGVGDLQWREVLAYEGVRNMSFEFPGGSLRIGDMAFEKLKLRQPRRSFTAFFDQIIAQPNMPEAEMDAWAKEHLTDIFQIYGIGLFRMADLDVVSPEIDRFHLGEFRIADLSSDGLGELAFENVDVAVPGQGSVGLDRFALGGMTFPDAAIFVKAIEAEKTGEPVDPMLLIPKLGFMELLGFDFAQGPNSGKLDSFRVDLADYIGPIPTNVRYAMRGLDIPVALVQDPQAQQTLRDLGYDRVAADYGFRAAWREADQTVTIDGFDVAVKDLGRLTADVTLSGLSRATIEQPKGIQAALPSLLFESARVTVEDQSIVGRALAMQAKKMNLPADKFREQIVGAVPLALMAIGNPAFQGKLAPALQAFLRTPGKITFEARPASPVPVAAIEQASRTAPNTLPDLLNVTVQNTP